MAQSVLLRHKIILNIILILSFTNFNTRKYLRHRLEEGVAECPDTETPDLAKALQLNKVSSQTRHNTPDVVKTQTSKVAATQDSSRNTKDCCKNAVTPVLSSYKRGKGSPPHSIETVATFRLSKHILEEDLKNIGN